MSRTNLDLAWSRIATATNHQYKRYFRAPFLALEPARAEFVRRLHRRLQGSWEPTAPRLPFDSSHIHGLRNVLMAIGIGEVPKMAVYEGRIRP